MGIILDTVLAQVTNSAAVANATIAPGNSAMVRAFDQPATAKLESVFLKGTAVRTARIASPLMHDPVRGITFLSAQAPAAYAMPPDIGQPLQSGDTLTVQATSGAADSTALAYTVYYSDLGSAGANLKNWGDISGVIEQIKPIEVDVTASATIGAWNDTVITTTENLLKANRWYAVLGFVVDVACLLVAFSGTDTSNFRASGPGSLLTDVTSDWFIRQAAHHGTPHIPVFNSANSGTTFVSVADNAASTAVKVQLVCALLSPTYAG